VRPFTEHEVAVVVQVNEPGFEVTVYPVIVEPPLNGSVQETFAERNDGLAVTEEGASGAEGCEILMIRYMYGSV
jgi:hypothetical protein